MVVLLAALAAWPLLTRPSLPTFTDAEMHVYRTVEVISAWQAGVPYIRWAPDLFYAFGYPVFHYYAPLSYYLGAAYGFFFGAVAGVKFVLVVAAFLGALAMYAFVRDRWGGLAGVVSAAAFSFAPYVVYIDPQARGDAPEMLAIGLAPGALWALARLRRTASPGDLALAGVALGLLILSHNLMALVFFGWFVAWLAWDAYFGQAFLGAWVMPADRPSNAAVRRRVMLALGLAVVLGLGLSAFMWLPAVAERNAVQFRNVAAGTYFDFRRYFIDVAELFAPAQTFDLGATEMRFHYSLGLPQWILALLGTLTVFSGRMRRLSVLFFAFGALLFIYLMLPASLNVWEALPPLAFMQFPYRFLGPAAVALGVLAGAAVSWAYRVPGLPARYARAMPVTFAALAVAACVGAAMPLLFPPRWPDFGPADANRILATELNGRGIGTTSANDFLPIDVVVVPPPQPSLIESYAAGQVDKVNRATLPAGTTVVVREHGPQHDRFEVRASEAFVLRLFTFWFPGWTAYVDGREVPIELSEPEGWITVQVPAGDHDVLVRLQNTLVRVVAWLITGLALAAVAALGLWRLRLPITRPRAEGLAWRPALALGAVAVAGLGIRAAADGAGWWRVESTGNAVLVADHELYTPFEGHIALLAYDLPRTQARPGQAVPVTLYWKALAPVGRDLRVFVHLIGPDGQLWGQSDKWNPADYPTSRWPLDRYVRDEHRAVLAPNAPAGDYQISVGLWDGTPGGRMRRLDDSGQPTGSDGVTLADTLSVTR